MIDMRLGTLGKRPCSLCGEPAKNLIFNSRIGPYSQCENHSEEEVKAWKEKKNEKSLD